MLVLTTRYFLSIGQSERKAQNELATFMIDFWDGEYIIEALRYSQSVGENQAGREKELGGILYSLVNTGDK